MVRRETFDAQTFRVVGSLCFASRATLDPLPTICSHSFKMPGTFVVADDVLEIFEEQMRALFSNTSLWKVKELGRKARPDKFTRLNDSNLFQPTKHKSYTTYRPWTRPPFCSTKTAATKRCKT